MYKLIAFFNENPGDIFVSFTISGTSATVNVNTAVNALPTAPTFADPYFQTNDTDSVIDACAGIPTGTTGVATFKRADLTTYNVNSNDFIGPRPPVRPH
jgi:hypothetical protein